MCSVLLDKPPFILTLCHCYGEFFSTKIISSLKHGVHYFLGYEGLGAAVVTSRSYSHSVVRACVYGRAHLQSCVIGEALHAVTSGGDFRTLTIKVAQQKMKLGKSTIFFLQFMCYISDDNWREVY